MESLSDAYGWTPNQIRRMRVDDIEAYLQIRDMKIRLREAEERKINNKYGK